MADNHSPSYYEALWADRDAQQRDAERDPLQRTQTIDREEQQFRRWLEKEAWNALRGTSDPSTRVPRVPASSRWRGALSAGSKVIRFHPGVRIALTALDLFSMLYQVTEGATGEEWDITPDFQCRPVDRFIRRGEFSEALCGTQNYMSPAAWNNYGWYQTVVSGYLYSIRHYGWQADGTWLGNYYGRRAARFVQYFDPPMAPGTWESIDWPDPQLVSFTKTPAYTWVPPDVAPLINTLDPESIRPGAPMGTPTPVPYRLQPYLKSNPYRVSNYQRQAGYSVATRSNLKPSERPLIFPAVVAASGPQTSTGGPRSPLYHSGVHSLTPPRKNEKEGKVRVYTPGFEVINNIVGNVTEAVDFIEAIYKAVPDEGKVRYPGTNWIKRNPSPQEKLWAIYENFDEIDIARAIGEVAKDQLEDIIFGKLGEINARASAQALPTGQLGLSSFTGKVTKRAGMFRFTQPK